MTWNTNRPHTDPVNPPPWTVSLHLGLPTLFFPLFSPTCYKCWILGPPTVCRGLHAVMGDIGPGECPQRTPRTGRLAAMTKFHMLDSLNRHSASKTCSGRQGEGAGAPILQLLPLMCRQRPSHPHSHCLPLCPHPLPLGSNPRQ